MRNVLVHAYFGINLERVWGTISAELPVLEAASTAYWTARARFGGWGRFCLSLCCLAGCRL
jgi:hypothetical protein